MHTIFKALADHAKTRPDAIAFQDDKTTVTWSTLATRVADLTAKLSDAPKTIGIALAGGVDYVVADLAITLSGRRQVPLPFFFSKEQNAHILFDAGIGAVIAYDAEMFAALPHLSVIDPAMSDHSAVPLQEYQGGAQRVIYTSGSSGKPKGVIIGDRQLAASLSALKRVVAATPADCHLSILPLPQLLEQICGIFLPILSGAKTVFRFEATKALFGAPLEPFIEAFETVKPTTSLLAPAILGRWVTYLQANGQTPPEALRFVAVGGASSSPALIKSAQAVGIPVCEGYGLSECCAVVAMNCPDDSVAGTVGQVLDGLDVTIENGEITVSGPTVMVGYLNGKTAPVRWHTGDLGHFEGDRLVIDGRKDALLVTGAGRNISPEWVEQRVNADPRIVSSALSIRGDDGALVLIVAAATSITCNDLIPHLADLPDYARPQAVIFVSPTEPDFLFPVGTPNRKIAQKLVDSRTAEPLAIAELSERSA
jgi:long-subunit acyl-CoA synthetase (AMP-forming)